MGGRLFCTDEKEEMDTVEKSRVGLSKSEQSNCVVSGEKQDGQCGEN